MTTDDHALLAEIPRLRRYARALVGDRAAADDLVQDTLERAWSRLAQWRPGSDLRAWLFRIMHNLRVDQLRRPLPDFTSLDEDDADVPVRATQADGIELADLASALGRLPEEQREVLLLVVLEDMRYEDVARTLDIPPRDRHVAALPGPRTSAPDARRRSEKPIFESREMKMSRLHDDDLHAYVDDRLAPARRAEVDAWLAEDAAAAERMQAYRTQNRALHQLFDPVLDEPVPTRLSAVAAARPVRRAGQARAVRLPLALAAGIAMALAGGIVGWLARDRMTPAETTLASSLPHHAAIAHAVFSPDVRRPVEITAEQEEQLVAWLSKRLGTPVRPPRLGAAGFELVGGRLLPGGKGPVAQFMYQDASGQRLTLYVSNEITANQDTAFRFAEEGAIRVFYWIDGRFGYALSAAMPKDELARAAKLVYDQLPSAGR